MRGLDPRIHPPRKILLKNDGLPGQGPAMQPYPAAATLGFDGATFTASLP
jgi:hypothetical protein